MFAWFVWEHGHSGPPTISWLDERQDGLPPLSPRDRKNQGPHFPALVPLPPPDINTVIQGNCLDMIPLLPNGSINLCLCSPPYADQRKGKYPGVPEEEYPQFTVDWMGKLWDKLTDDGSVLIVIDPHVKNGVMADYVLRTQFALVKRAGKSTRLRFVQAGSWSAGAQRLASAHLRRSPLVQ